MEKLKCLGLLVLCGVVCLAIVFLWITALAIGVYGRGGW